MAQTPQCPDTAMSVMRPQRLSFSACDTMALAAASEETNMRAILRIRPPPAGHTDR